MSTTVQNSCELVTTIVQQGRTVSDATWRPCGVRSQQSICQPSMDTPAPSVCSWHCRRSVPPRLSERTGGWRMADQAPAVHGATSSRCITCRSSYTSANNSTPAS